VTGRIFSALLIGAAASGSTSATSFAAVINSQLARRGRRTFATPGEMAGALFGESSRVDTAFRVLAAVVLLGAAAALVSGVWQTLRGERGGVERVAGGVFGVIGLMAALAVVM
jgi:hypothetical protein